MDVSTGVEAMPGVKDPRKLRAFVVAARRAAGESEDAQITGLGVHEPLRPQELDVADGTDRVGEPESPYDWDEDA
ncbi:MAG: hypothetical protein ABSH04_01555 [Acidimicrobiales bacterium]